MDNTIIETLPILNNLTNEQFEKLLGICTKQELPSFTVLYKEGDKSLDMYILTRGELKVLLNGEEINRIFPISTVGEMGVFTREARSATIISIEESTLLRIMKKDLFDLFAQDKDFHIKFQEGMLLDLSQKIRMTNKIILRLQTKLKAFR